jgi:hypothetical protein
MLKTVHARIHSHAVRGARTQRARARAHTHTHTHLTCWRMHVDAVTVGDFYLPWWPSVRGKLRMKPQWP